MLSLVHIATVRAVQGDRYEVVEQNFLDFDPALEPHWASFDLRSVAWPDSAVVGFIDAPPLRWWRGRLTLAYGNAARGT
jgi:hypothetical protein